MSNDSYPSWWTGVNPAFIVLDPGDGTAPLRLMSAAGRVLQTDRVGTRTAVSSGTGTVSTLTPLTSWIDLSAYCAALIYGVNLDATSDITAVLDTSETSTADSQPWELPVSAGKQFRFELDLKNALLTNFRLSAYSNGFVNVSVSWAIVGILR